MLVVADTIKMPQGFNTGSIRFFTGFAGAVAARCVFAQVMDDGARSRERLQMIVKAKACEFRHAELFAKDALAVVALEGPLFKAGLDAAGSFKQRSLCGFKELLRA